MAEHDDELRRVVADVLDVVQGARVDVEHLAGPDREARELVGVVEDGHEQSAGEAVGELVRVRVPVRFADRSGLQHEALDRQAVEEWELVGGEPTERSQRAVVHGCGGREGADVSGFGNHGITVKHGTKSRGNRVIPVMQKVYEDVESDAGEVTRYRKHGNGRGYVALKATAHPTAHIEAGAYVEPGAEIAAGAYVGAGSWIDRGAFIGAGAFVGSNVHVGRDATVAHSARVGSGCRVSDGVRIGEGVRVPRDSRVESDRRSEGRRAA